MEVFIVLLLAMLGFWVLGMAAQLIMFVIGLVTVIFFVPWGQKMAALARYQRELKL